MAEPVKALIAPPRYFRSDFRARPRNRISPLCASGCSQRREDERALPLPSLLAKAIHGNPLFKPGEPRPTPMMEGHVAPCGPGLDSTGAIAADADGCVFTIPPYVPDLQSERFRTPQRPQGVQRERGRCLTQDPAMVLIRIPRSGVSLCLRAGQDFRSLLRQDEFGIHRLLWVAQIRHHLTQVDLRHRIMQLGALVEPENGRRRLRSIRGSSKDCGQIRLLEFNLVQVDERTAAEPLDQRCTNTRQVSLDGAIRWVLRLRRALHQHLPHPQCQQPDDGLKPLAGPVLPDHRIDFSNDLVPGVGTN